MTKQQKARAHLARAQELLQQDTLAFGAKKARVAQETEHDYNTRLRYKQVMTGLLKLPDDVITKMITDGMLDGAQLIMLLQVNKHNSNNLNRIIKNTLVMMSKRYDDDDIFEKYSTDLDMIYLLVKHGDKRAHPDLFNLAIVRKNRDLVTALLQAGEAVNHMPNAYTTPLSLAVSMRAYDIAKILTDYGADVNQKVRDYDENPSVHITPLDLAFKRYLSREANAIGDELDIVKLLLKKGADPKMMSYLSQRRFTTSFMQRDMKECRQKDLQLLTLLLRARWGTL